MAEGFINTTSDSLLASVGQAPVRLTEAEASANLARARAGQVPIVNPNFSPPTVKDTKIDGPKLPVVPTKINTKSGKGVPGGFEASSVKTPGAAASKALSNMTAIISKLASLSTSKLPGTSIALSKLNKLMEKQKQKQLNALNAPKFNSGVKLPSPPEPPDIPDFGALGIPEIPEIPEIGGISATVPIITTLR